LELIFTHNFKTMAITLHKEHGAKCVLEWRKKKASVAITIGDAVTVDADGYVLRLTANAKCYGIAQRTVASTDSDYASATRIPVLVCGADAEYEFLVATGTPAQSYVGDYVDFNDHDSIDLTASTNDDVQVTDIISATLVLGKLSNRYVNHQ
jgi:hypothetical protein